MFQKLSLLNMKKKISSYVHGYFYYFYDRQKLISDIDPIKNMLQTRCIIYTINNEQFLHIWCQLIRAILEDYISHKIEKKPACGEDITPKNIYTLRLILKNQLTLLNKFSYAHAYIVHSTH